jgi:hypothetical protein
MLKILALQTLDNAISEMSADSATSVTCTGCSCASNVCISHVLGAVEFPVFE